jgi:hypothetical protein
MELEWKEKIEIFEKVFSKLKKENPKLICWAMPGIYGDLNNQERYVSFRLDLKLLNSVPKEKLEHFIEYELRAYLEAIDG